MLEGCDYVKLFEEKPVEERDGIPTYRGLLETLICDPPRDECYYRICLNCKGTEKVSKLFVREFDSREIEFINYKLWAMTDSCMIENTWSSSEDFIDKLCHKLEFLLAHDYIAKKQSRYYNDLKMNLKPGEIIAVLDFSENYAFTIQDAVQAFWFNDKAATVFPVAMYYKENNQLLSLSFVGISAHVESDCLKHDVVTVYMFQKKMMDFLKERFAEIIKIHHFSNGVASQFKNKKAFVNLAHHSKDFGIDAEWNFFATAHGKGPSDAIGGIFKREAKNASLRLESSEQIGDLQLYEWGCEKMKNIHVVHYSKQDYEFCSTELTPRFIKSRTVLGTRGFHCVITTDTDNTLFFKRYSDCVDFKSIKLST